jgi:hypothetical protein
VSPVQQDSPDGLEEIPMSAPEEGRLEARLASLEQAVTALQGQLA